MLAFNKPYGVPPCFTGYLGLPTLAECVTIPEVYVRPVDWIWLTSLGIIRTSCRYALEMLFATLASPVSPKAGNGEKSTLSFPL